VLRFWSGPSPATTTQQVWTLAVCIRIWSDYKCINVLCLLTLIPFKSWGVHVHAQCPLLDLRLLFCVLWYILCSECVLALVLPILPTLACFDLLCPCGQANSIFAAATNLLFLC
jgi:hypothetical protein